MARKKSQGNYIPRRGRASLNGVKSQRSSKKSAPGGAGLNLLTKFGVRSIMEDGSAGSHGSADFRIVMGLDMGGNSGLIGIIQTEYLLTFGDKPESGPQEHYMIGDTEFAFEDSGIGEAIYARFGHTGSLENAPATGPLGDDGWHTFNAVENLIPSLKTIGILVPDHLDEVEFDKGVRAVIDALSQIAFSCFITSGVVLTGGSFKPLLFHTGKAEDIEPNSSEEGSDNLAYDPPLQEDLPAIDVNAGEDERRQSVDSENPG